MREMNHEVYLAVNNAINMHDLACHCYICKAFTSASNGSKGFDAACNAVIDKMIEVRKAQESEQR